MRDNKQLNEALNSVFEKFNKDVVEAVYLTGSNLNNLDTATSDVDFYVVLKQNKKNLVFESLVSKQEHGEHDFKYMESYKFVQLLCKTNPNMLEMVYKYPVYVSESFRPVADLLFERREDVVNLNLSRYYSSSFHLLKNNYNKLKNGSGKVLTGRAGKEVMNFYKTYYQVKAHAEGRNCEPFVITTGDHREFLLSLKKRTTFSTTETLNLLKDMKQKLDELEKVKNNYKKYTLDEEFMLKLVELL